MASTTAGVLPPGTPIETKRDSGAKATAPTAPVISVHILTLLGGFAGCLWFDRRIWFFSDDWEFIVDRGLHHPPLTIWQPHNEHWSTLPILLYRLLFSLFGLHFLPYLLALLVAHVVLAHLIWRSCLRQGVDPWVATAWALLFVFLGAGAENITWAFAVSSIGALLFGYLALEAAWGRPSIGGDALMACALLASLMCSTIGDAMVVSVGVVLLLRRGWLRAIRPLAVPVAAYGVWFATTGHQATAQDHISIGHLRYVPGLVWHGAAWALGATADLKAAGSVFLVALLALGLLRIRMLRARAPETFGLLLATAVFYVMIALGRQGVVSASRYVYVAMALLVPVVAVVTSAPKAGALEGRLVAVGVVAVLVVVNVGMLDSFARARTTGVQQQKAQVISMASLLARGVRSLSLAPVAWSPNLTPADLRSLVRSGELRVVPVSAHQRLVDEAAMGVVASPSPLLGGSLRLVAVAHVAQSGRIPGCMVLEPTAPVPQAGFEIPPGGGAVVISHASGGTVETALRSAAGTVAGPTVTVPPTGSAVVDADASGDALILTLPPGAPTQLCSPPGAAFSP